MTKMAAAQKRSRIGSFRASALRERLRSPLRMKGDCTGERATMISQQDAPLSPGINTDPFLARLLSLHTLSLADQMNWICSARVATTRGIEQLSTATAASVYEAATNRAAIDILKSRLEPLDTLYMRLIEQQVHIAESVS